MRKTFTQLLIMLMVVMVGGGALSGQEVLASLGDLSSGTNRATAGLFTSDADDFIDPTGFGGVELAKSFFLAGGQNISTQSGNVGLLDLGFAANLGGLYLGTWYRGDIIRYNWGTASQTISPTWDDDLRVITQTTDTTEYPGQFYNFDNQIEFLIGVGSIGIKLGFMESVATAKDEGKNDLVVTDYKNGIVDYQNETVDYKNSKSYLKPYLGFGGNFDLGGASLSPYLSFGFGIYSDTLVDNTRDYSVVNGVEKFVKTSANYGHSNGYLEPAGTVGISLGLPKSGTKQATIGVEYSIDMLLYNNSYGDSGIEGDDVKGTVNWGWGGGYIDRVTNTYAGTLTETSQTVNIDEKTYISHEIVPSLKIVNEPSDDFKFGFKAGVPISFGNSSSEKYGKKYEFEKHVYTVDPLKNWTKTTNTSWTSGKEETSFFDVSLVLTLGASYKAVPGKLTLNGGIGYVPFNYTSTTVTKSPNDAGWSWTEKTEDSNGKVISLNTNGGPDTKDDSSSVTNSLNGQSVYFGGGFTFDFNQNTAVDVGIFSYGWTPGVNVVFTFKF